MANDTLGQNIARFREALGLSQSELARRLNVSSQAVSRWEHGGLPDTALLPRIARELECSLDALFSLPAVHTGSVQDLLSEALSQTVPEQRLNQSIGYAWHMMKMNGALADSSVESFFTVASSCENADAKADARNAITKCSLQFDSGLMLSSVASDFKYVLMMNEPETGFDACMKEPEAYRRLFSLFSRPNRLEVFLLGFTLPQERLFTRDYVCGKLKLSPEHAQEILDELCAHRMLGCHNIQATSGCTEAYYCHQIPIVIPFLYFAGAMMREGKTYYLSTSLRQKPLLRDAALGSAADPGWEPRSSKEHPAHFAYTLTEKSS